MSAATETVFLLDDEPGMVRALTRLLRAEGFAVRGFTSVREFLAEDLGDAPGCLVLDVAMPELDGLKLQEQLVRSRVLMPVIFLTGHGDIPMSVRAIKSGAVDFLTKPVDDVDLLRAVRSALLVAGVRRQQMTEAQELRSRYARLTPREREVMKHVVAGRMNKQIAGVIGTGEQTVKVHRARVMAKLGIGSLPDLVRAAQRLDLDREPPAH